MFADEFPMLLPVAAGVDAESVYSEGSSGVGSDVGMLCGVEAELAPEWLAVAVGAWRDDVDDTLDGMGAGITAADAESRSRSSSGSRRSGGHRSRLRPV
jgi:hypothetical protein